MFLISLLLFYKMHKFLFIFLVFPSVYSVWHGVSKQVEDICSVPDLAGRIYLPSAQPYLSCSLKCVFVKYDNQRHIYMYAGSCASCAHDEFVMFPNKAFPTDVVLSVARLNCTIGADEILNPLEDLTTSPPYSPMFVPTSVSTVSAVSLETAVAVRTVHSSVLPKTSSLLLTSTVTSLNVATPTFSQRLNQTTSSFYSTVRPPAALFSSSSSFKSSMFMSLFSIIVVCFYETLV